MSFNPDQTPKSLCILRLSAIGDITNLVPVVQTVRKAWPDCNITWIIGKLEATLIGDLPGVEFIIFDKSKGWRAFADVRRLLRGRRFDVLLHMQAALRASLLSLLVRAPIKLGFDRARAYNGQWLFTNRRIPPQPGAHVLDGFFAFIETLGIRQRHLHWNIPVPEASRAFAADVAPGRRLLVINACSNARFRSWRNWPAPKYAQVAEYAARRHNLQVVLTGGPSQLERETAEEIIRGAGNTSIINLVGRTTLKQLLAVLQRATAVIAPDTGPAHIATAAGVPVIGLYASTNALRAGPYLSQKYVINKFPEALRKFLGKDPEAVRWGQRVRDPGAMDLIQVDEVTAMLDRIITET
jgi:heptosyltransferase I